MDVRNIPLRWIQTYARSRDLSSFNCEPEGLVIVPHGSSGQLFDDATARSNRTWLALSDEYRLKCGLAASIEYSVLSSNHVVNYTSIQTLSPTGC